MYACAYESSVSVGGRRGGGKQEIKELVKQDKKKCYSQRKVEEKARRENRAYKKRNKLRTQLVNSPAFTPHPIFPHSSVLTHTCRPRMLAVEAKITAPRRHIYRCRGVLETVLRITR
jgi:hypothetical protein